MRAAELGGHYVWSVRWHRISAGSALAAAAATPCLPTVSCPPLSAVSCRLSTGRPFHAHPPHHHASPAHHPPPLLPPFPLSTFALPYATHLPLSPAPPQVELAAAQLATSVQGRLEAETRETARLAELQVLQAQAAAEAARAAAATAETARLAAATRHAAEDAAARAEAEAAAAAARRAELEASDALARSRDAERVRLEEASALRLIAARAAAEGGVAGERARAEAEGRALEARQTADLRAAEAAAAAAALQARVLAVVAAVSGQVQGAAAAALTTHLHATLLAALGLAAALHGGRALVAGLQRVAAAAMGTPSLVRESSALGFVARAALRLANAATCGCAHAARRRKLQRGAAWPWLRAEGRLLLRSLTCGLRGRGSGSAVRAGAAAPASPAPPTAVKGGPAAAAPAARAGSKAAALDDSTLSSGEPAAAAASRAPPSHSHHPSASLAAPASDPILEGVVLDAAVEARVRRFAAATRTAQERGAPLRHALLHGPPGTGKTLVAQRIARSCGLDYAVMSGGDVAALGPAAVAELHALFAWAAASPFGLVLFIDEAEAFLGSRRSHAPSAGAAAGSSSAGPGPSDQQTTQLNALATLLQHTGGLAQGRVSLVLATNRPQDLDEAVLDRMDDCIHLPLPGPDARARLGRLYFHAYVSSASQLAHAVSPHQPLPLAAAAPGAGDAAHAGSGSSLLCRRARRAPLLHIDPCVTLGALEEVCRRAEGFSGRQMAKLMLKVQAEAYADAGAGAGHDGADAHTGSSSSGSDASGGAPAVSAELLRRCLAEEALAVSKRNFAS